MATARTPLTGTRPPDGPAARTGDAPARAEQARPRLRRRRDRRRRPRATQHPRGWWIGFLAGFAMLQILAIAVCWLFYMGVGIWGINVPVAWGFAIVNFVWWIGIGHAGTLISAILLLHAPEVADAHQPLLRGDDDLRGHVRGHVPALAHGPAVVLLLALPVPERRRRVAAVPQPADVGRVRGHDVLHRVAGVLVRRPDPRPRRPPRPGPEASGSGSSTASSRSAGAARRSTGGGTRRCT